MKMPKNCINILIVGLDNNFCAGVAETLSEHLQMHFATCESIISYYVQERELILEKVGLEYLKQREKSAIKECSNYCDCVLSIGYDLFKHHYSVFKNSIICYIKLRLENVSDTQNKIMFKQRDEFLTNYSNLQFTPTRKDKRTVCKNIIEKLGEIL